MDTSQAKNHRKYLRQVIDDQIKSLEIEESSAGESIRALRHHRNALAPISSLPTEVIIAIFSFFHVHNTSFLLDNQQDHLGWLHVTHICHQWREIALNHPLFWSHIDFTAFSSAGTAEILARAKMAPLYLEARVPSGHWGDARFSAFHKELQDHVSHICHLTISARPIRLNKTLEGLVLPAPALEYLSLCSVYSEEFDSRTSWITSVPDTLFDGTTGTPRLSSIKLWSCDISWQSPLLRGIKHLEIRDSFLSPNLSVWLDALDEMSQLKTLVLHCASPTAPPDASFPSDVGRTVTLPCLTVFEISSPARDCGLALAHLVLPALTSLRVISIPLRWDQDASDVREILPYVARHAHGPQDTQPLQSMLFNNDTMSTEFLLVTRTLPDIDVELPNVPNFSGAMLSARVALSFMNFDWLTEVDIEGVFDAVVEALPLNDLVTVTSQSRISPLNEQFWLRHAPRWTFLLRVCLSPRAVRGFRKALLEDNGGQESPLLPSLKELVLTDTALRPHRTLRLCDALMKRVEQGVPLETLDLRTCFSDGHEIELLGEIVVDVLGPDKLFASMGHGFCHEDDSVTEDDDNSETGSDDVVCLYDDEHEYHDLEARDEEDYLYM